MVFLPFAQIFRAQLFRPTVDGIVLRLLSSVLRLVSQGGVLNYHGSLGTVKADEFSAFVIQIAAQENPEVGIVVESLNQVGKVPTIFPAKKPPTRLSTFGHGVCAGNEVNAGDQMHKQVASQTFAIIAKAAPAEETDGIKGPLERTVDKGAPVDGLLAGIGGNRIHPGAARVVAVPIGLDRGYVAEFARVVDLLGFG